MKGSDYARLPSFICWVSVVICLWLRILHIIEFVDTIGGLGFILTGFFSGTLALSLDSR